MFVLTDLFNPPSRLTRDPKWSRKFRNFETLNSAFITLLPKIAGAKCAMDFRPISLVHSFAKLETKLLANRLAGRLQQMVSPYQSAFTKGRFIQDNFMLVQQTQDFYTNKSIHVFSSSWISPRHSVQYLGLFFLRY